MQRMVNGELVENSGEFASIIASDGSVVPIDQYAHTLTYNTDGTLATISFTDGTKTFTRTYTYTGGNLTGVSAWVAA